MKLSIAFTVDSVEFTPAVIAGEASLGGSESSCLGLARALQKRGHEVHIFASKLSSDAPIVDQGGVTWHRSQDFLGEHLRKDFDVVVALREAAPLGQISAKFRILWNQDLMTGEPAKNYVMGIAWAYDAVAYVSRFHQHQWESYIPELKGLGWVTKNGYDPTLVPKHYTKDPNRIIHVSRPERGLLPILKMWPLLRQKFPEAELQLCRYSSMYDPMGWGSICAEFDRKVAAVNEAVGGITYLGELGKPALYKAIAEAACMWYPGIASFAETSCIAAIEAQACGTPFIGSYKGALPETVPGGVLLKGDAERDPEYWAASIAAVGYAMDGCRRDTTGYRQTVKHGKAHVKAYTYDVIAVEWEAFLLDSFRQRYETNKPLILGRLLHEDDHALAQVVAAELGQSDVVDFCDRVIAGKEQTAEAYATFALDPRHELAEKSLRMQATLGALRGCKRVLDIACGSGAYALALAQDDPERTIVAVDYAQGNIDAGKQAAEELGIADRIEFICAAVWDFDTQEPSEWLRAYEGSRRGAFDGLWVGEFLEHIGNCTGLINALDRFVRPGGQVFYTMPIGPLGECLARGIPPQHGHVHHFRRADIDALFGNKNDLDVGAMTWNGTTPLGTTVGHWLIAYTAGGGPSGPRPVERRILVRPRYKVTAGIICNNTLDLRRCLDSVWPVVDEIIVGNTGVAEDELASVLQEFPRKTRSIDIGPVHDLRGGFSEARNAVLAECRTDWFFWIDTDEILCGGADVAKYLEGSVYHGYAIQQQHLQLDVPMGTDKPVRLFRRRPDVQFYGCVHEQPQMGDCNGDIVPCLQIGDVQLAHTGYLHESVRRQKALQRNMPLLVRDQEVFPDRELGKLLCLRECANLALWAKEKSRGVLTDEIKAYQSRAIVLFEDHFMDPENKFHALGRPFYEAALKDVASSIEVEVGMLGAQGGLNGNRAKSEKVWVRTPEHLRALLQNRLDAMLKAVEQPETIDCEPFEYRPTLNEEIEVTEGSDAPAFSGAHEPSAQPDGVPA